MATASKVGIPSMRHAVQDPGLQIRGLHWQTEREREIHYVHWASEAYEDESMFMSEAHLGWQ